MWHVGSPWFELLLEHPSADASKLARDTRAIHPDVMALGKETMIRIGRAFSLAIATALLGFIAQWNDGALAQSNPIKVGVIGPFKLTPGRDIQEAASMAVDEIDASGGVLGRKIELVFAETEQNPEKGKTAVERLLFVDKVDVVLGEHRSEVALAVQPIIMENKKIFLATGTASPLLSENVLKDYNTYKYYFRTF